METNKILDADLLDIIFEGKNKEYGAYEIRKTYNRRLIKALLSTVGIIFFICAGYFLSGLRAATVSGHVEPPDIILGEVKIPKADPPPPLPLPKPQPVQIKTLPFTTVQIVKVVPPEEKPLPTQDDLIDTKIGKVSLDGVADQGITAPASDEGKGVVAAPKDDDNGGRPFIKVEKESEYPGGLEAWRRYMIKNFRYPEEGINNGISGVVIVQFIVDRDGNVSDVHAISGPDQGGLRQEAERVIKKSGKWVPAIQNGRPVKSYKSQPVVFQLEEQ